MTSQTIDFDGAGAYLGSRTDDAPAAPGRAEAGFIDTRTTRTKTTLTAKLAVPAASERWHQERERVRLAHSKVAHRINDALAEDRTTPEVVLSEGLDAAASKERVPLDLFDRLEAAYRRTERARFAGAALAKLTEMHTSELHLRFTEIEAELRQFVADEIRSVLSDAVRLAPVLDGIATPEQAMKSGLSAQWLERDALAGRWLAVQRSRAWLARASRDGFEPMPGGTPDRLRRSTARVEIDIWRSQFADHIVSDHDTAAAVLQWYVLEVNDGEQPTPLV